MLACGASCQQLPSSLLRDGFLFSLLIGTAFLQVALAAQKASPAMAASPSVCTQVPKPSGHVTLCMEHPAYMSEDYICTRRHTSGDSRASILNRFRCWTLHGRKLLGVWQRRRLLSRQARSPPGIRHGAYEP